MKTSKISGFYKLSLEERLEVVGGFANLTASEIATLKNTGGLSNGLADQMIEKPQC